MIILVSFGEFFGEFFPPSHPCVCDTLLDILVSDFICCHTVKANVLLWIYLYFFGYISDIAKPLKHVSR